MNIIKAELKHLDEVMRIENEIFPVDAFTKRSYSHLIKKGWVFLAVVNGKFSGHGCMAINRFHNGKFKGRIYSVGVLKQFRGKGIATALIKSMEKAMEGAEYISLETHLHHKDVIRLYERLGYEITDSCLKDYYTDGDGVRMVKKILRHLPDVNYKTISRKEMRFRDAGDWWDSKNSWKIRVPRLGIDYEFMIFIHEAIERYFIMKNGYSVSYIDNWIKDNLRDSYKKGAMTKGAPQRSSHIIATRIEKMLCKSLGIKWKKYSKDVDGYVENLFKISSYLKKLL